MIVRSFSSLDQLVRISPLYSEVLVECYDVDCSGFLMPKDNSTFIGLRRDFWKNTASKLAKQSDFQPVLI